MKSVGISLPAELLERIDKQRAMEGVRTGKTPSRSEWWREAAEEKLSDSDVVEVEVPAEA